MKWKKTRSWRPVVPPIATREQSVEAIAALPGAQARLDRIDFTEDSNYWLWTLLLDLLHNAVEQSKWDQLTKIIHICAGVSQVGERGLRGAHQNPQRSRNTPPFLAPIPARAGRASEGPVVFRRPIYWSALAGTVPHSGQRCWVARRSYPQTAHWV